MTMKNVFDLKDIINIENLLLQNLNLLKISRKYCETTSDISEEMIALKTILEITGNGGFSL